MIELLKEPWPWYVSGILIGLTVPLLLILGNKTFGISSSLMHICAACIPTKAPFFKYNWKSEAWNLFFVGGILIGSFIAHFYLSHPLPVKISSATINDLKNLGIQNFSTLMPLDIFNWNNLFSIQGIIFTVVGGFMVGFGTRYANGCTSGHSIMGLSNLQFSSLVATICFMIGGFFVTHLILPLLLQL